MNFTKKQSPALIVFFSLSALPAVANGPADRPEASYPRTSVDGASDLTALLSQNVYRNEQRTENYTEQVPYTVDVPYTETITENVPETHCRTNSNGQQTCETIWITRTREVTRYRRETRYRAETRTRVVTVRVFDRQWSVPVRVIFPAASALEGGERELATVRIAGTENSPRAEVRVESEIFAYGVAEQSMQAGEWRITLRHGPRYSRSDVGAASLALHGLTRLMNGQTALRFEDRGLKGRSSTARTVEILDAATGAKLHSVTQDPAPRAERVDLPLPSGIDWNRDLSIRFNVTRAGASIEGGGTTFTAEGKLYAQLDPAAFNDPAKLLDFAVVGTGANAKLRFRDDSPALPDVKSEYLVSVYAGSTRIAWGSFVRNPEMGASVEALLRGFQDYDAQRAAREITAGRTLGIEVIALRSSPRLASTGGIRVEKAARVRVEP